MRMTNLFEQHHATLIVTIIVIRVFANAAFDYAWHSLTLTPMEGGESTTIRKRYFDTRQKNSSGEWKINLYIDNVDVAPMMPDADILIQ
jgi:ketosteroid isomerase-like protein